MVRTSARFLLFLCWLAATATVAQDAAILEPMRGHNGSFEDDGSWTLNMHDGVGSP